MPVNATTTLSGFLFVDKPVGPTSHDVVAAVRRTLTARHPASLGRRRVTGARDVREQTHGPETRVRVGHAGTLDPLASGLLILGLGLATKLLGELVGLDKTYEVTVRLGATSATDDGEGPIAINPKSEILNPKIIDDALQKFIGEQMQVPPAYSAKKQRGVRLYKLARRGETVTARPQRVIIHELRLIRYRYPDLELAVRCSSGTYVRALARDIGAALGVGGYVQSLRRTAIGPFSVSEAISAEIIDAPAKLLATLRQPLAVIQKVAK
jgi:tRNA pseudouridine55 synthase